MLEDKCQRDTFIEENLRLVHSICKRFIGRGIEYDDLYQAGCIGLIKAADGFKEDLGFCFSTYAVPVIMGEVRRLFRDGGAVKVSRNLKELSLKINQISNKLTQVLNREPTIFEIAEKLQVSTEEITEAICASQPVVSLTYSNEEGIGEADLPTVSTEDLIFDRLGLDQACSKLSNVERNIISYRYYKGMTQSETAKILNMSQVQVSRYEKKILCKLRELLS